MLNFHSGNDIGNQQYNIVTRASISTNYTKTMIRYKGKVNR